MFSQNFGRSCIPKQSDDLAMGGHIQRIKLAYDEAFVHGGKASASFPHFFLLVHQAQAFDQHTADCDSADGEQGGDAFDFKVLAFAAITK